MSHLGGYQIATTLIKKLGGPGKAVALVSGGILALLGLAGGGGYLIGKSTKENSVDSNLEFIVRTPLVISDKLQFSLGDKFRILNELEEGFLIELLGATDNPYVITKEQFNQLTNK